MKFKLFHRIGEGGAESAAVRQFLVENGLTDLIEFSNVAYTGAQEELRKLADAAEAPALVVAEGHVIRGRELILDWLRTNVLAQRE